MPAALPNWPTGLSRKLPVTTKWMAKKLLYKPKKVNGRAVETAAVKDRIVFDHDAYVRNRELRGCPR